MSSTGSSHEQTYALDELIEQVRALSARIDALDERERERSGELQGSLDTALRALEFIHDEDPDNRRRLRELRASADYESAFTAPEPLVSVVIPTWNRAETLVERAIPSALEQTHPNIEVIVVGDNSPPDVSAAITELGDPRVTFHNLTIRGPYDEDPSRAWLASGTPGLNAGMWLARGLWIAPLGDDDAFVPEHIERLLAEARNRRLEFVYGRIRQTLADGNISLLGEFPPRLAQIGLQASIYHTGLRFMELELGHALFGKPNDWGLVHRMMRVGVRMAMVEDVSVDYSPSSRNQSSPPPSPTPDHAKGETHVAQLKSHVSELERRLEDECEQLGVLNVHAKDLARRLEEVERSRSWRLTAPLRRLRARI